MIVLSNDLMPDDIIGVHCEDGSTDIIVVGHVHWEADCVMVYGYSPWHDLYGRAVSLPFNARMEIWNG